MDIASNMATNDKADELYWMRGFHERKDLVHGINLYASKQGRSLVAINKNNINARSNLDKVTVQGGRLLCYACKDESCKMHVVARKTTKKDPNIQLKWSIDHRCSDFEA